MKNSSLIILSVLVVLLAVLSTLDTEQGQECSRSHRTYSYHPASNAWGGNGDETLSVFRKDETDCTVAPLTEANITVECLPALTEAGSPLGAPPTILEASAMTELTPVQLPPLDAGMVNVTGGFDGSGQTAGYRVNPRPGEFAIAVPYDPSLLPQGFTEDDIQTYVYDRQHHRWAAIQRDSVNEAELLVCSRFRPWEKGLPHTRNDMVSPQEALSQVQNMMSFAPQGEGGGDSPLDFINAVLKTPEMPETSAYTPTSIKELKAADPLEGLTLMQPPTANNSGTANLSYPIEIPAGRQGMQPNLALTYSSGGGNGWLGVGWDISIPSITVETRWGVPRYDQQKESEVYVYEGEQLVTYDNTAGRFREMPHRTNQWTDRIVLDQDGYEQFYPRKNEAFDSIVRHGNGPDNYWWTVTHRNGVTDYYGKYASDAGVNNNCVLRKTDNVARNDRGAIAHWALAESVDPDGNSVRYYYDIAYSRGVNNGSWGKQIYVDSISYTCLNSTNPTLEEPGKYSVIFQRKGSNRTDIVTSLNRGVKEVTAEVLCHLDVSFRDTLLRQYFFVTKNDRSTQYKTVLTDIVRVDSPLVDITCGNVLDSTGEIWGMSYGDGEYTTYAARYHLDYYEYPVTDSLFTSATTVNNLPYDTICLKGVKSTFRSTALGATKTKSWSLGGTGAAGLGPDVCTTIATLGANSAYSNSQSEGLMTLVDLDGDGLADKVFKKNGRLFFRKQLFRPDEPFAFDATAHPIEGGELDFLKESGNNVTLGLQASCAANLSGGFPFGWSTTTNYMTDINGDGLVDIVTDRGAYFGKHIQGQAPSFSSINAIQTTVPGQSDTSYGYISSSSLGTGNCGGMILDGAVDPDIACTPACRETTVPRSDTIPSWILQEGCTAQIVGYKSGGFVPRPPLVTDSLIAYQPKSRPSPGDAGPVATDSMIVRIVCPDPVCSPEPLSPDFDAVRVWVAPYDDSVKVFSSIRLSPELYGLQYQSRYANGVFYSIEHNTGCSADANHKLHATGTVCSLAGNVGKCDTMFHRDTVPFYVRKDDILFFRIQSKGDRSFDKAEWNVHIEAVNHSGQGNDIYGRNSAVFNSDSDFVLTGRNLYQALQDGHLWISGLLQYNGAGQPARLVIKRRNIIEYQRVLNPGDSFLVASDFAVDSLDTITVRIERMNNGGNPQWPNIHFIPLLKYYPASTNLIKDTVFYYPQIQMDILHPAESPERKLYHKYFGALYRGWGQFAYNRKDMNSQTACIDISSLELPGWYTAVSLSDIDTSVFSTPIDTGDLENSLTSVVNAVNNPLSSYGNWIEMTAYNEQGVYRGSGLNTAVSATFIDNTEPRLSIPVSDSVQGSLSYGNTGVDLENIPIYDYPVPVSVTGYPVQTIRKRHRNNSSDFSMGMDMMVASVGTSESGGGAYIQSDYMDLNGDRYPDPVSTNGVQYSMPWGGIGSLSLVVFPDKHLSATVSNSDGETSGRCYPTSTKLTSNNPKFAKMTLSGSGTVSQSDVSSRDYTDYMLFDVNGDGLPDMVNTSNKTVMLNVGYGFLNAESWNVDFIRKGSSNNHSDNAGLSGGWANMGETASGNSYSLAQCSISGGTGNGNSHNRTTKQMTDFNGDGLPDKVETFQTTSNSGISVRYNLGNGQWSATDYITGVSISESQSVSEDVNIGVTAGFTACAILKINIGVQTSPYNRSLSTDVAQLTDINGDGYPDYITSTDERSVTIRYNRAGKTNLLRKVTNFTGSTIDLDYELSEPCYEKPQRSWNLSRVETNNNVPNCPVGGNRTLTTFSYGTPHYDRYERMEFGYDTVRTIAHNTDSLDAPYRQNVMVYNNVNLAKRGRKVMEAVLDSNGTKYVVKNYRAVLYDFLGNVVDDSTCSVEGTYVGHEAETTIYYEGQDNDSIVVAVGKDYDRYRNITRYTYEGIRGNGSGQRFTAHISYKQNAGHNLVSLPDMVTVCNHDSTAVFQRRTAEYDGNGHLTRLTRHNGGQDAVWDFHYDPYGNMVRALMPPDDVGQRTDCRYTYDPEVHTYPVKVENHSLGFSSTAEYDLKYGKPAKTTDINGNVMRYGYDGMGRMVTVTAPYELDSLRPYTIRMEYHPHNFSTPAVFTNQANPYSYAVTRHFDPQHPGNDIVTTVISDGLGRMLQTKKDAEIGGQEVSLVTGKVVYDCFGRTVAQYHPFTEDTLYAPLFNPQYDSATATVTAYDILDRPVLSVQPYGRTTATDYGFGSSGTRRLFRTTVTDPMGNEVTVLKDGLGLQVRTVAPMNTVTLFEYDPVGQLLATTDPDGFSTEYEYDMLGRMIQRVHPDAGRDRYTYDAAGNMTAHVNGNGDSVIYSYHYSLPTRVSYPRYPANNVRYWYGAPGAPDNCAGKVAMMEDGSGWQTFSYGKLGELTGNIRIFALPNENQTYTFRMQYQYDSYNRIQTITYPDGETVSYRYDRGGMLESVRGDKGGDHRIYVENISYNTHGLKESVFYGNGTHTDYGYDLLMRLSHLYSENGLGEAMQDIDYGYDDADNITDILNSAMTLANGLGGNYWSNYDYDNLYRLGHAEGDWGGGQLNYHLDMQYHPNGRIERKELYAEVMDHSGTVTVSNYSNSYLYNAGQPNTLGNVTDDFTGWEQNFSWDAAGNMTVHDLFEEGCSRQMCWDEENRLAGFSDCHNAGFYQYDANGERTYKLTGGYAAQNIQGHWWSYNLLDNPTLYASPYVVATTQGYTKHYYAESERIASRIGGGGLADIAQTVVNMEDLSGDVWVGELPPIWGEVDMNEYYVNKQEDIRNHLTDVMMCAGEDPIMDEDLLSELRDYWRYVQEDESVASEPDCYWYHPDHLGSSSWITYTDGEAVQHLHYLPWGEEFVNQRSSHFDGVRYTFSAKERDTETGLSYFGARYYSSDLSIWLSVDPMSDKYPSLSPYVYCANNPVKLVDPNGEEIGDYFDQYGTFLGSDCRDDGKIHIIDRNLWNQIGNNMSWMGNDGVRVISHDLASDEHGGFFSTKPSETHLSDEAVVNIFEHYNQSAYSCVAMRRGSSNKLDNGELSGLTTDHPTKRIMVRIDGNIKSKVIDNYNEIINLLQHEEQHVEDRIHKIYGTDKQSEERAILRQIQHPTFAKTRESFQNAVYEYARTLDISF
ncbi:MAG: hypothetical protein J6T13_01990 [Bacteroidales bacterium]|nr:hypothetical protein [Bacteroidales bacterium]